MWAVVRKTAEPVPSRAGVCPCNRRLSPTLWLTQGLHSPPLAWYGRGSREEIDFGSSPFPVKGTVSRPSMSYKYRSQALPDSGRKQSCWLAFHPGCSLFSGQLSLKASLMATGTPSPRGPTSMWTQPHAEERKGCSRVLLLREETWLSS